MPKTTEEIKNANLMLLSVITNSLKQEENRPQTLTNENEKKYESVFVEKSLEQQQQEQKLKNEKGKV